MIPIMKRIKWQTAYKRSVRSQRTGTTYSQYRHYFNNTAKSCGSSSSHTSLMVKHRPFCAAYSFWSRRQLSYSVPLASSSSVDVDDDGLDVDSTEMDDIDNAADSNADQESEDEFAHIRVKLYPLKNDEDRRLERLYEAASVQQVFDVVEEDSEFDLKVSAQALVTLWDLQKILFKINANFSPEKDYFDRPTFIDQITKHPTFVNKILTPVLENCEKLEDEPLLASLLCLQRMGFNVRSSLCEKFLDECLRRQDTLSLPSLSRLCVCMRTESLYGNFVVAKFYPLLWNYIGSMKNDMEIRLVAISLRNTSRIITESMIDKFRSRIFELKDDIHNWNTVTLTKVFILLMALRNQGLENKEVFELVGEALIPRVPTMQLMEVLSLQKFLELGFLHPYNLVESLVSRMKRIVQEGVSLSLNPRLDLLASMAPHLKTIEQRQQIASMLQDYLENHPFELASQVLLSLLRWTKTRDNHVYDQFWTKAADLVDSKDEANVLDRRILILAKDYISFCYGFNFSYRNSSFEISMKRYLYRLIYNYMNQNQPCLIHPGDISRAFTFLIGTATFNDPLFHDIEFIRLLDDFAPQFKPVHLVNISRGLDSLVISLFQPKHPTSKYYDIMLEVCSILEEQSSRVIMNNQQAFGDMLAALKVSYVTRRIKGDSPIGFQAVQNMLHCDISDPRTAKELMQNMLLGIVNNPSANDVLCEFIGKFNNRAISPEILEKYVILSFALGWESSDEVLSFCNQQLTREWDKLNFLSLLQASLGLCYHRQLSKEMVQNIFSVEFLDQLDAELAISYKTKQYPLKLRQSMMELNRAVCLDMPDTNLPWFHAKFCEDLLASNHTQESYLHKEVKHALSTIVGDEAAVQANMCSPYYYKIDFLVEFDEKNRPIRKIRRKPISFFQKFKENSLEPKRKVAVLILHPSMFTRNVRQLRGAFKLRRRHLEILGYDVVEIDPLYWNSMFMSENSVRHNFLESKLYSVAV